MRKQELEAKNILDSISREFYKSLADLSREQLQDCLKMVEGYNHVNCGWVDFHLKEALSYFIKDRITLLENTKTKIK